MMKVSAIIAAAGVGRRMKADRPKQLLALDGTPIIVHTVRKFEASPVIHHIIVAAPREMVDEVRRLVTSADLQKPVTVVKGGERRQDSVSIAMQYLPPNTTIVAVHDAVRPFVSLEEISSVTAEADRTGAAILAIPIVDTVKQVEGNTVEMTLTREHLVLAQTPQAFRTEILREAFEIAKRDEYYGTDEASLVERIGRPISVVRGSERNIKITRPADLVMARAFLEEERTTR
jgi:2-C-methyl-D-erythritol 4-phosphate cytidylyltransferase